jgi:hypothetical protein
MKRPLLLVAVTAALALLLAACDGTPAGTPSPTPAGASPTPTTSAGATPTATATGTPDATPTSTPQGAICAGTEGFEEDGALALVSESGGGDAVNIGPFRWERHGDECERFVIDLLNEQGGEARAVGDVTVEFIRELGVIRATFPDIEPETVAETDGEFDGPLAVAAYTVRAEDRSVYVDLHLGEAVTARAFVLSSPARVAIDVQPGGDPLPPEAARDERVVVLTPRGDEASYPLEITGYARTFEANVIARIRQGGELRAEEFTTATDWTSTWGEFTIRIDFGPTGAVELFVGEESARDGSEQGVRLDLTMR